MRTAGLLVLAILLPVFAHAAPPTLATYTVSHNTIYPAATTESGLATTTSIDIAFSEQVRASIKILSSDGTKIKSLYPSSGSSSDPVTNPTPKIWNGKNDAGTRVSDGTYTILISATSTATGLTMTDSSKSIIVASSDSTSPDTSSDTDNSTEIATTPSPNTSPPEYLKIPTLRILAGGSRTVSSGADTVFTATVYDSNGNKRDNAFISWSFGDGMQRTGANVYHKYYEPGEYVAVVHASTSDGGDAWSEIIMTVKNAGIKISSISSRGITLMNSDSRALDLSLWRLSAGDQEFKVPADTKILAGRSILFPSQVTGLLVTGSARLLYPSGEVAAEYPEVAPISFIAAPAQPSVPQTSFNTVQTVEPPAVSKVKSIISPKANIQENEKAVIAPAAATELAAAGAASAPRGVFGSPWLLSLIGVLTLAGTAFVFL